MLVVQRLSLYRGRRTNGSVFVKDNHCHCLFNFRCVAGALSYLLKQFKQSHLADAPHTQRTHSVLVKGS